MYHIRNYKSAFVQLPPPGNKFNHLIAISFNSLLAIWRQWLWATSFCFNPCLYIFLVNNFHKTFFARHCQYPQIQNRGMEIIYFIYKFISILHRKCLLFNKLREHPSGVDVGSDESGSYVMVYSIEEVSHGHVHMGNGGFQSGILMARIPISDTRNYCGGW